MEQQKYCPDSASPFDELERELVSTKRSELQHPSEFVLDEEKPDEAGHLEAGASDRDHIVDWDGRLDPHNPQNWTGARKWTIIGIVSAIAFNQ
jgi:hypothetical protein